MRITLDLDDEVIAVTRSTAQARGVSLGRAVSDPALEAIKHRHAGTGSESRIVPDPDTGFPALPGFPGHVITNEMVADVLDED